MEFEIFNDKNARVFYTQQEACIPDANILNRMIKAGYKIKLDGKNIPKSKITEITKEVKA